MRYFLCVLTLFIFINSELTSQAKWDKTWITSNNTMEDKNTIIDFNVNPIRIDTVIYKYGFWKYYSLVSSYKTGGLLLYSNGCEVIAQNGLPIINGDEINLISDGYGQCLGKLPTIAGHQGWAQDIMFIPLDTLDEEFLLVYNPRKEIKEFPYLAIKELASSRIILNNNIEYEVVEKDKVLFNTLNMTSAALNLINIPGPKLAWWLITADNYTNIYYRLYVSKDSLSSATKMVIDEIVPDNANGLSSKFNPDGTQYAKVEVPVDSSANWVYLFNFERTTGELSYNQKWQVPDELSLGSGLEFSASGRFLYVTRHLQVYQYDMWASDIPGSVEVVAEWDGFQELGFIGNFFYPQRAPDCRIYINSTSSLKYYHYINHPEVKGKGCDVRQHALELVEWHAGSIPFFPNYRLDYTCPVCDSTLELPIQVSSEDVPVSKGYMRVGPNPCREELRVMLTVGSAMPEAEVFVYDVNGRLHQQVPVFGVDQVVLDTGSLQSGVYILQLRQRGKIIQSEKFIKIE